MNTGGFTGDFRETLMRRMAVELRRDNRSWNLDSIFTAPRHILSYSSDSYEYLWLSLFNFMSKIKDLVGEGGLSDLQSKFDCDYYDIKSFSTKLSFDAETKATKFCFETFSTPSQITANRRSSCEIVMISEDEIRVTLNYKKRALFGGEETVTLGYKVDKNSDNGIGIYLVRKIFGRESLTLCVDESNKDLLDKFLFELIDQVGKSIRKSINEAYSLPGPDAGVAAYSGGGGASGYPAGAGAGGPFAPTPAALTVELTSDAPHPLDLPAAVGSPFSTMENPFFSRGDAPPPEGFGIPGLNSPSPPPPPPPPSSARADSFPMGAAEPTPSAPPFDFGSEDQSHGTADAGGGGAAGTTPSAPPAPGWELPEIVEGGYFMPGYGPDAPGYFGGGGASGFSSGVSDSGFTSPPPPSLDTTSANPEATDSMFNSALENDSDGDVLEALLSQKGYKGQDRRRSCIELGKELAANKHYRYAPNSLNYLVGEIKKEPQKKSLQTMMLTLAEKFVKGELPELNQENFIFLFNQLEGQDNIFLLNHVVNLRGAIQGNKEQLVYVLLNGSDLFDNWVKEIYNDINSHQTDSEKIMLELRLDMPESPSRISDRVNEVEKQREELIRKYGEENRNSIVTLIRLQSQYFLIQNIIRRYALASEDLARNEESEVVFKSGARVEKEYIDRSKEALEGNVACNQVLVKKLIDDLPPAIKVCLSEDTCRVASAFVPLEKEARVYEARPSEVIFPSQVIRIEAADEKSVYYGTYRGLNASLLDLDPRVRRSDAEKIIEQKQVKILNDLEGQIKEMSPKLDSELIKEVIKIAHESVFTGGGALRKCPRGSICVNRDFEFIGWRSSNDYIVRNAKGEVVDDSQVTNSFENGADYSKLVLSKLQNSNPDKFARLHKAGITLENIAQITANVSGMCQEKSDENRLRTGNLLAKKDVALRLAFFTPQAVNSYLEGSSGAGKGDSASMGH